MFDFFNKYIIITRRDVAIRLPRKIYKELKAKGIDISLVKTKTNNKPSCVQLTSYLNGKQIYHGTLKAYMNVKKFKNGDVCDFHKNNLILKG